MLNSQTGLKVVFPPSSPTLPLFFPSFLFFIELWDTYISIKYLKDLKLFSVIPIRK